MPVRYRLIPLIVWLVSAVALLTGSGATAHSNTVGIVWSGNQPTGTCVSGSIHALNCSLVEIFFGSWHTGVISANGELAIWRQVVGGTGWLEVIGNRATPSTNIAFSLNHSKISALPNYSTGGGPFLNYNNKSGAAYAALNTEFVLGGNFFWGGSGGLVGDPANASNGGNYKHQSAITTGLGVGTYKITYANGTVSGNDWAPTNFIQTLTFTVTQGGSIIVNGGGDPAPLIQGPAGYAGDTASSMNLTVGQTTLYTYTANEAITWSLTGGADQSLFNIHSTTGALTFQNGAACGSPNTQGADNVYVVRVTATDGAGNTPFQVLTLNCPPELTSSVPTNNATGVAVGNDIVLTFSKNIQVGTGNITLFDSADNIIEAFDVTSDVTISGATVRLNPAADLGSSTTYYVQIAGSAIDDTSGNSFAGIGDKTTLRFTSVDTDAPTLTFSPANGATGVAVNSNITVTASEAIRLIDNSALSNTNVDALITLKVNNSSGADISFDATISSNVITIDPTNNFGLPQQVYVSIGTTVEDSSDNAITGSNTTFTVGQYAPVANAGTDQIVAAEAYVTLDGSNSSDIEANPLTYLWSQSSGTIVTLSSATVAQPTFTAPKLKVDDLDVSLIFALIVNDGQVDSTVDTVTITVQPLPQTPLNKFLEDEVEISQVLIDGAERSLYSSFTVNRGALQSVRKQFFSAQDEAPEAVTFLATRGNVPFDIGGSIVLSRKALNASGSFFVQNGNSDGTFRQLFSGDFDVQRDGNTGSSTATLTARAAWEYKVSDDTVLSYFIGGEAGDSAISGAYYGIQTRSAASFGSYAVHKLFGQLYLDGFLSFGAGWNNLELANDILKLESDYVTQTLALGGALSGLYENTRYELRPELAFSYGKTWIGVVDFTGRAYGQIDTTLTSDIGDESVANLTLRPEVILALGASTIADSQSQLSFAPRLFCERQMGKTSISSCGDGAEIGIRSQSEDGLSSAYFRIILDKIYGGNRSSYSLNLEHKF